MTLDNLIELNNEIKLYFDSKNTGADEMTLYFLQQY